MSPEFIDWNNIPDTISKDQFCKICHMSKRTATKYLGTIIPCSDNGKKTHRYTINKTDLISFLERTSERQRISTITPVVRCSKTGYGKTIVITWFLSGTLRYVVIRGAKHTTKENLIDFMSSDEFDKIFRKSDWHLKQIKRLRSIIKTKDLV